MRATCGTTTATSGPDDSTINFDGPRHDSGKGQQGNRMHDDFDGRHDDNKGQQGNRRHNGGDERAG